MLVRGIISNHTLQARLCSQPPGKPAPNAGFFGFIFVNSSAMEVRDCWDRLTVFACGPTLELCLGPAARGSIAA